MSVEIKRGVAAFGLFLGTSPSLFPVAETAVNHEVQTIAVQNAHGVAARHLAHLLHEVHIVQQASRVESWHADSTLSPTEHKLLNKKVAYVNKVLVPLIDKNPKLDVVTPTHTEQDPVNSPGQLLVVDEANKDCAIQFYVDVTGTHVYRLHKSSWGNRDFYDGRVYGHAVYAPGMLAHMEGADVGKPFPENKPQQAVAIIQNESASDQACKTQ